MCSGSGGFAMASTYLDMKGKYDRGVEEYDYWRARSSMSGEDAENAKRDSRVMAQKLRLAGESVASGARAAFGASGVDVTRGGTPEQIEKVIASRAENDALETILQGNRRYERLFKESNMQHQAARNALSRGENEALGSFLSFGAKSGSGWG